jgi:hypothetical protein
MWERDRYYPVSPIARSPHRETTTATSSTLALRCVGFCDDEE